MFRWSVLLNSELSRLQLVIGIRCGSLALIGDAVRNLGDVAGLLLGWGRSGWALLRDALRVALDGVPAGIELAAVSQSLLEIPGVRRVHHVHIWGMSTSRNALTTHLERQTGEIDDTALLCLAQARLADLGIVHSALQLEPWGNSEDP